MTRLTLTASEAALIARHKAPKRQSLEPLFAWQCKMAGVPEPVTQHLFAAIIGRRWRFDFAWPQFRVALEVDGLTTKLGRHQTIAGMREDMRKGNNALILGWSVIHCEQSMVRSGEALKALEAVLLTRGWSPNTPTGATQ